MTPPECKGHHVDANINEQILVLSKERQSCGYDSGQMEWLQSKMISVCKTSVFLQSTGPRFVQSLIWL